MADNRKLAIGLQNFTPAAREDMALRAKDLERGKTVELLRRAGKEMYDNPVVNAAISFTPGAGDLQSGYEAIRSAREGNYGESALNALGVLPFIPSMGILGKTVWHGSPHTFDKFDLSKIGTGEGAQAYGHGLYLAESPETAKMYRDTLSKSDKQFYVKGNRVEPEMLDAFESNVLNAKGYGRNKQDYLDELEMNRVSPSAIQQMSKVWDEMGDVTVKEVLPENASLYKVDLPDEQIAKMLDWDKPLSEQPDIQQAFVNHLVENQRLSPERASDFLKDKTAGEAYGTLSGRNNQEIISQSLLERGIPGIQYLDQASRGAGDGTRNYVVFSDEIPQILERNNQPVAQALREYRGAHTAPGPEFGAQLHDLTGGGQMYPDDVYSANAYRFYGHGGPDVALDKETTKIAQSFRGKPDEMVSIYRAVPNQEEISMINPGDWITINPNYAKVHGESVLGGDYKILEQKVPAKSVWTNADSIHEYGYWPE